MQVFIKVHTDPNKGTWLNVSYISRICVEWWNDVPTTFIWFDTGVETRRFIVVEDIQEVLDLISGVGDTEGKRITLE